MTRHTNRTRGYTLIELVVAVGLFAIVMMLAAGGYLVMIAANRQAQAVTTGENNLSFALEYMTRTIRTGSQYGCGSSAFVDCAYPSGNSSFSVLPVNSASRVTFSASGGAIYANGNLLTDSSVTVTSLMFYLSGSRPNSQGEYTQPYVTIVVTGTVNANPGQTPRSFTIQSSAAMRGTDL